MLIRPALPADCPAISALACKTYAHAFGASMSADDLADVLATSRSPEAFAQAIAKGDTILVALDAQQIIGYVLICAQMLPAPCSQPGDQTIKALYVDPDHQRRGLGRSLMDAAFALPRCRDAQAIYLDVWEENAPALALYTALGFTPCGKVPVMAQGKQIDEDIIMRRPVTHGA